MQKKLFIISMLILLCVTVFYFIPYQDEKVKREFDLFYSSQLSGKIIKIEEYSRGSNFILENNPNEYAFYPYTDKRLNNNQIFQYIAKPGDSVFKSAYSDTLFLIKGNKTYSYTFRKI
ncbi:hypothetical protein ACTJIJ_22655 [Niabella sp. 22666]|uniref:hypothetical protein n=1 Tax=Niabella sp. 22666 TaxID=3453954 RepID=UPI003F842808